MLMLVASNPTDYDTVFFFVFSFGALQWFCDIRLLTVRAIKSTRHTVVSNVVTPDTLLVRKKHFLW